MASINNTIPIHEFLPVGFRFRPTDEELVGHYLKHKLQGDEFPVLVIPDIDLCKVEPSEIPGKVIALSAIKPDDPEWFFFSPRDYKYARSTRSNRKTEGGYWKATGQDRNIRARGTNNVIGSKKTLVFYTGRSTQGVKTNWVIHEYHATTFDDSQRKFVLCRLMKKAEKKAEGETNPLAYYEGEPSGHMASDVEYPASSETIPSVHDLQEMDMDLDLMFQQPLQAPSLHQSPISFEQETSFPVSPSPNIYIGNATSSMHSPFENAEEKDYALNFANSVLANENFDTNEGRAQAFMVGSAQSESLRMVHHESSDTDAEVVSARVKINPPDNIGASSRDYHVSKMVQSSHGAVYGGTHAPSSNREACREKKEIMIQDNFWGVETSSSDSTADNPLEINFVETSSSPSLRRWKNQYQPGPDNFVSQRAAGRRSQSLRKVSSNAVSHLKDKKLAIVESKKDQEKSQNTSSRKNIETRSSQDSDLNERKGYFICQETPSSSQSLFPRSVYLVNVVVGILLFIVISWELLSC